MKSRNIVAGMAFVAIFGVPISMRMVNLISAPLTPSFSDYMIGYAAVVTLAFFVLSLLPKGHPDVH